MNNKIWNRSVWGIVFIVLLFSPPYVFRQFLPFPSEIAIVLFSLILFSSLIINKRFIKPLPSTFNVCIVIQTLCWLVYSLIHNDSSYLTRIIYIILTYTIVLTLSNSIGIKEFIKKNNQWVAIQAFCGLLAFIFIIIGLLQPFFTFQNVDGRTAYCYGLTCSNAVIGNVIRAAGFFDEPGALAFWGMYALIFNQLFIKEKKIEIALVIGLLSTFSMAYYIQLFIYGLFYKLKLNIKSLLFILMIGIVCLIVYNQGPESDIYKLTYGRFEVNEYGEIETNRDVLMEKAKQLYLLNPIWGNGAETIERGGEYIADNPYETLANDGIIGTIVIYLPLILILLKNLHRREVVLGVIIIAVGYLQRPFHLVLLHYIMLYSFLYLGICDRSLICNYKSNNNE